MLLRHWDNENPIKTFLKLLFRRGSFRSYSESGEDGILHSLFQEQRRGFYVDVGAYHPHLYSNTYALYRAGWHGLAIDPNPLLAPLFKLFRPRDTFVCAGIGEGTMSYHVYKQGAWNGFKEVDRSTLLKKYPVKLSNLSTILKQHGVTKIDLLNVDVEGLDFAVVRSHDWSIKPSVLVIETATGSPIQAFLEEKGYKVVATTSNNLILKLT
jgi:FkbM family methyltransferase